jgi:SAM-dependent methyltransferase
MRNKDKWVPSALVYRKGKLVASRNPKEVGVGSRLTADLAASFYDANIRKHAKGKLIDLGCGKVPLFEAYKDFVTENICVDWDKTPHSSAYVDCMCDLSKELPFRDGVFDTLILSCVLEHIQQPDHLWKEMSRILTAGGKVLMNVPFYYWLHETPHDYYRYTEYALRRFAKSSDFEIVLLKAIGGTPEILADILAKHLQYAPLLGKCLASGVQYITHVLVRRGPGKRLSERTSKTFPFGYFLVAEKRGK